PPRQRRHRHRAVDQVQLPRHAGRGHLPDARRRGSDRGLRGRRGVHGRAARRMPGGGRGRRPSGAGEGARHRPRQPGRSGFAGEGLDAARPRSRWPGRGRAHRRRHVAPRARGRSGHAAAAGGLGAPAGLPGAPPALSACANRIAPRRAGRARGVPCAGSPTETATDAEGSTAGHRAGAGVVRMRRVRARPHRHRRHQRHRRNPTRDRRRDKEFSERELRRNLEAVLAQAGAQQVFEGPLRRGIYYGPELKEEIGGGFIDGVNLDRDARTSVHVLRLADRNVWVQLATTRSRAGLVVVEERPFTATARWTGQFPYLSMPEGYDEGNRPRQRDFDMYPFWTGEGFEEVEGRTWAGQVMAGKRARSMHEVRRNLQAMMAEAGGELVFEGRMPKEASERYGPDLKGTFSDGTGYSWHDYESL